MGWLHATEYANSGVSLEKSVTWQLRYNFFPPHPIEMVPVAIQAIEACLEGDYERLIDSPHEHKTYGFKIPANKIVEIFRLEPWIENAQSPAI